MSASKARINFIARERTFFGGFKLISYSRWKSYLVMSNQQPVSSLGFEAVMPEVSVDKRTFEP